MPFLPPNNSVKALKAIELHCNEHTIYTGMICTKTISFFPTNINCVVTLSQKISNMGVISNVNNNLAMYVGGNALTNLMHKSFLITTEKE